MKSYKIAHTDLTVSRLAYGCFGLGYDAGGLASGPDAVKRAERLVRSACDQGINFFDHADVYGGGLSEQNFGAVLKSDPGLRETLVIQSKCGARLVDRQRPEVPPHADLSRAHIVQSVEGSLGRLGTDHLDILLLHLPDALAEPDEIAAALDLLQDAGKVRYFGVSNHSAAQIALLQRHVRQPIIANQMHLGLEHGYRHDGPWTVGTHMVRDMGMELTMLFMRNVLEYRRVAGSPDFEQPYRYDGVPGSGLVDYCRLHDIRLQAYAPLRGDILALPKDASPDLVYAAGVLGGMAATLNITPISLALAWLLRHPAGIVPIIGSTNPDHIVENCLADQVQLSREDWYALLASASSVPLLSPAMAG